MAAIRVPKKRNVTTDVAYWRGVVGGLNRALRNGERTDNGELAEAEENLRVAVWTAHVERLVKEAPPLTDEQRTRLAELLRPIRR